jgi:iron(III) transport system permease protein
MQKLRHASGPILVLGGALVLLALLCLYPLAKLVCTIIFSSSDSFINFELFSKLLSAPSTYEAIQNTFIVSSLTAFLSTLIALPLSWTLSRSNVKGAKAWKSLFCLSFAIPPYIGAIAWIVLANPSNGLLNSFLGVNGLFNIYSLPGLVWVMSSFFYTFVLLSLFTAFDRMDPSLEEAARLSGASPLKVFKDIVLPLTFPSLLSGILLVFLESAASFGVPALIGGPAKIYMMTTKIYMLQKMGSQNGTLLAGALAIILLLFTIVLLAINKKIFKRSDYQVISGKVSRESFFDWGNKQIYVQGAHFVAFSIIFILPIVGIFISATSRLQGVLSWNNFSFSNFYRIFSEVEETPRAIMNSLKLAVGAATCATALGVLLAYIQKKTKIPGRRFIDVIVSVPYATPGTVIALALILSSTIVVFGAKVSIYNTLWLIGIAYLIKYLNFSVRTTGDGIGQINDVLAEAARVSGASWTKVLTSIWIPLLLPALMASWFLVFMPSFSELTMTLLLSGPGNETVGTLLYQLQEYSDVSGGGAAVLALLIVFGVACMNYLVKFTSKGKYGL